MDIKGKVVVVTGGAKGLGRALVALFSERGARVIFCDKDIENDAVNGFVVDVTNEGQVSAFAKKVASDFRSIDVWINNAGIWMPRQSLGEIDIEKAERLFQTNVFGTIHGMRAAIKQMKKQQKGTIVNIISTVALDGMNNSSGTMYVASKYALRGITNNTRKELEGSGINLIAVYPGGMKTELFDGVKLEKMDQFLSVETVAATVIENLERAEPERDLIIKRSGQ